MIQVKQQRFRIALIINPYAGIGGEAALKGSDGQREQALQYSQELRTPARTVRFLQALGHCLPSIDFVTAAGLMGADSLQQVQANILHIEPAQQPSSNADTQRIAKRLLDFAVDLFVFVGGDGTARDMVDSVAQQVPCLGVPGGVKMQSGVFAISPEAAAEVVKQMLTGQLVEVAEQDVRDIDEEALRQGRVRSRYYGSLLVPREAQWIQNLKQGGIEDESLVLDDIAQHLTDIMQDQQRLMLVGPGSSLAYWMDSLGLPNTLVGFDAILDGELLQSDLTSQDILRLQQQYPDLYVVITPTGQQGFLFGRGNQQLNKQVLRALPKQQLLIIASQSKLRSLQGRPLLVDSNDAELDKQLAGFYPIITAYQQEILYPVNTSYLLPEA
jgi:predicted polyphosphate/ATP-dependent NAD kinase